MEAPSAPRLADRTARRAGSTPKDAPARARGEKKPRPRPSQTSGKKTDSAKAESKAAAPRQLPKGSVGSVKAHRADATNKTREGSAKKRARDQLKQTLLGGLSPAVGSAPRPPGSERGHGATNVWVVALSEELQEEKTLEQVIALHAQGMIDADTVVWREGMDQWQGLFEVEELAQAFRSKGVRPSSAPRRVPGSGVRDVPAQSTLQARSDDDMPLPSFDLPSDPSAALDDDDDDQATVMFDSPFRALPAASSDHNDDFDVEEATIALDRNSAQNRLLDEFEPVDVEFDASEDDLPTQLLDPFHPGTNSGVRGPRPAAGIPATASSADAAPLSFPAPSPPTARQTSHPPRAPLAAPVLDFFAQPQHRSNRTLWLIAFALFVGIVLTVAIYTRLR